MKSGIIVFLIFLTVWSANGQSQQGTSSSSAQKNFDKALNHFELGEGDEALKYLQKAIKSDPDFIEAYMMMSQIYKDKKEYKPAIESFEKALAVNPLYNPPGYLILAEVERELGMYEEAIINARKFLELKDFRKTPASEAERIIGSCTFSLTCIENPVPFVPENLGDSINSDRNEYWPSLNLDESRLIITVLDPVSGPQTQRAGSVQEDFYQSTRLPEGSWSLKKNLGPPLNTPDNEGAQTISADGRYLYFTGCNRESGKGKCDIYGSVSSGGTWNEPFNLDYPVNTAYSEKHPTLSPDGRTLYFASDRPGGFGGLDIWVSTRRNDGLWSLPVNLGEKVNTPGEEQSPFIHPDNHSLYFSSSGHMNNLGKGDIFVCRKTDEGKWSEAVNLGYPINTWNNEVGLIVNAAGNLAYFASDRLEGKGLDIYEFPLYQEARPVPVSYMKGRVYDSRTWKGIEAVFQLIDLQTGQLVMESTSTPGDGAFLVSLPVGKNYALNVSKPGYLFYSDHFNLSGVFERKDPFLKDVPLSPVIEGEKIVLRNIFYAFDSFVLEPESETELMKILDFLNRNPSLKVEISGHTDNIGNQQYNQDLSEKRARSVVEYLQAKGIEPGRLSFKGYGSTLPVSPNDTEEGRGNNRRTELRISSR